MSSVFPVTLYFPAYGNTSYNVVAFTEEMDATKLRIKLERLNPEIENEIFRITGENAVSLFHEIMDEALRNRPRVEQLIRQSSSRLHTDDFPVLEFRWAHGAGLVSVLDSPIIKQ